MTGAPALFDQLAALKIVGPSVVSLGTFDGVHRGHQALLHATHDAARARAARSVAITFDPRPREVLRPDVPSLYLCTLADRVERIRRIGVDRVIVLRFDQQLAATSAADFVAALRSGLGMVAIVGGPDLALGYRRQGTPDVLRSLGERLGFVVQTIPPFLLEGEQVRSGQIRQIVLEGDVIRAARLLGHWETVTGTVVHGAGRGRGLGIPTANVATPERIVVPGNGIYAVFALVDGQWRPAVASIGTRPVFDDGPRSLEVFVLDWDGNLYGQEVSVAFIARLRDELSFPTVSAMMDQITHDIQESREILARTHPPE